MEALTTTALTLEVLRNAAFPPAVSGEMTKTHQYLYLVGHIQAPAHGATVQPLPTRHTVTLTDAAAVLLVSLRGMKGRITHHLEPALYNAQTGTWEKSPRHYAAGANYAAGGHYPAPEVIKAITGTAYPALPVHDRRP